MEEEKGKEKESSEKLIVNVADVLNDINLVELADVKQKILIRKEEIETSKIIKDSR